ncbi:MAG: DUF4065 domain-containing protein [Parcubacteria group bacterium]|nr:DUF4065 domain-containing protein [Parcubacteria group bacterium]
MVKELYNKKLKLLREKGSFSQEQLAEVLGISRPTYMQIEKGERELTISEAKKLASFFGTTFKGFLAGDVPEYEVIFEDKPKTKIINDLKIRVTSKNLDKFKQVLLYILGKVGGRPNVGETVLHKLLYFIDFDYYEKFEENLIGATYIKNHHGPTSVELKDIIADMKKNREIEVVKSKYFKYEQKKYLALKRPNLEKFSAQEIEHIDDVLARLADKNAKEIESYSHEDVPWRVAKDGKPLSYESVFYRDERYSMRNYEDEL